MKKNIVITGGTGLIGSELIKLFSDQYKLILLTRNPKKYTNTEHLEYQSWDGKSEIENILNGCYAVINLIGENIGAKKWTTEQKEKIKSSRTTAAQIIKQSIDKCEVKPKVWVQASATGYYGQTSNTIFNENSPKGSDSFLADVCDAWEKPIRELSDSDVRKVIVRTGVVLAPKSELWKQLTMSYKFGVATIPGNGKQHLPWIHIDDEANAIYQAATNDTYSGTYNLCAPNGATMKEIVKEISKHKTHFITLNIPRFFMQILFGKEMTNEIILSDQNVTPQNLLKSEFQFRYKTIDKAISNLINARNI